MLFGIFAVVAAARRPLGDARPPLGRAAAAASGTSLLWPAAAAHAASVSYDFGYRFERAIDPSKRGPASNDVDMEPNGMSALDAMCNPMPPDALATAASDTARALSEQPAASPSAATTSAAAAAAAAATASAIPADPASSAEPIFGVAGAATHIALLGGALDSSLILGVPLMLVVFLFLRSSRSEPNVPVDPMADAQLSSIQSKIFNARMTGAPGFMLVDADEEEADTADSGSDDQGGGEEQFDNALAKEAATVLQAARRSAELKAALQDAIDREDFEAASAIKKQLDASSDD